MLHGERLCTGGGRKQGDNLSYVAEVRKCRARCIEVKCKRGRKIVAKLKGGAERLEVETGRWRGV